MWNLALVESAILDMIPNLRQIQRKSPSAEELLKAIKRPLNDEKMIPVSLFRSALDDLLRRNIIFEGGRKGSQSFYIMEDKQSDSPESTVDFEKSGIQSLVSTFPKTLFRSLVLDPEVEPLQSGSPEMCIRGSCCSSPHSSSRSSDADDAADLINTKFDEILQIL